MSSTTQISNSRDSAASTKLLFNRFFSPTVSYPSAEVDAVVGFFVKRGFEQLAAFSVSSVILQQAKTDNVKVFELLDTLAGLDKVKLSNLVLVILNSNRSKISRIGYKDTNIDGKVYFEARNIIDVETIVTSDPQVDFDTDFSSISSTFDNDLVTWDGAN
jgi:hypothetical protein